MNYWGQPYGEKHYCERPNCQQPSKLASNQFCSSCHQTIGPIPTCVLKSEFVAATKQEIASQHHIPDRFQPQLSYGYPSGRLRDTPENHWSNSSSHWPSSASARNDCQPVLGYYRYTLVKQPRHSSVRGGKLFGLMIIGAAVWF
ncbi:hypothetical protein QUB63_11605 [Microcoleus sp. ARI1-B5]|uniref:hypothetical protein n=1 Tax=unclassified Microcoleus TaxID=2642155 RepID=UPI002FD0F73C